MHFEENTKFGRATALCNGWIRFWVKGKKNYRKTLEWVMKRSKHSVGYLSAGLCNNSSSCKEKKTAPVQDSNGLPLETLPLRSLHHEGLPLLLLRPSSHNDLFCYHWHRSVLEATPNLQWFRPLRCYVHRQVPLPDSAGVIIHASSDLTIMLRLLHTRVPIL